MSEAALKVPTTPAEIAAYNRGVADLLEIATRAANGIRATSRRVLVESFATAVLDELATAGRALLIPGPERS